MNGRPFDKLRANGPVNYQKILPYSPLSLNNLARFTSSSVV